MTFMVPVGFRADLPDPDLSKQHSIHFSMDLNGGTFLSPASYHKARPISSLCFYENHRGTDLHYFLIAEGFQCFKLSALASRFWELASHSLHYILQTFLSRRIIIAKLPQVSLFSAIVLVHPAKHVLWQETDQTLKLTHCYQSLLARRKRK